MLRVLGGTPTFFLTVMMMVISAGCGGSSGDGYSGERGQVSGKVTLEGSPIPEGCQVIFVSKEGGYTASGLVEAEGAYKLNYSDSRGLPAGEYEIQLTAPVETSSTPQVVDPTKMAETMRLNKKSKGGESDGPFPTRYGSTMTSKLFYTVNGGENSADLELTK